MIQKERARDLKLAEELAKGFVNNHIPEPEDDKNI